MAKGEGGGWRPGGGGGPVRRGPKADWMPTAQTPKSRSRQIKIAALAILFLALIGVGVFLYYYLSPPNPPVLLIITTDPSADAADLQAPIDPYGWQSGQSLERWSQRYDSVADAAEKKHAPRASNSGVLKNTETPKTEEDLADWVLRETRHSGSLRKASETAILYFGLHTGADSSGAFLYGNKGQRFHVEPLLQAISTKLGTTRVLVLFDPARQLPDPSRGVLHDGFVDAMRAMNDKLVAMKNITVILGCDSGERGWESEELKRTAFAHAVVQGLGGKASPGRDRYVTGLDLFRSVQETARNWTRQNRPSAQNPVLLPQGPDGEQRAFETTLMLHHAVDDEAPSVINPMPGLMKRWEEYGKLLSARPGPEVYTPRRWRRYRELLLRYEYTARASESKSAEAVETELDKEARAIRTGQAASFIADSRTASAPMWQASGQQPAIALTYDSDLRRLGTAFFAADPAKAEDAFKAFSEAFAGKSADRVAYSDDIIRRAVQAGPDDIAVTPQSLSRRARLIRFMWDSQPVRPPDVQLFLMFDQFSRLQDNQPWPAEKDAGGKMLWQRAILVRRLAEDAALGPVTDLHPYSEAVWRVVQAVVQSGDDSRRRAEDLLFTLEKDRTAAFGELVAAEKQYKRASDRAVEIRAALALRDEAMADLPHLGRWSVFEGEDKFNPKPRDLWKSVHKLAKLLDEIPPENAEAGTPASQAAFTDLKSATDEVRTGFTKLKTEYADAMKAELNALVKLQSVWLKREKLLAVPPLTAEAVGFRGNIVEADRKATEYFASDANKTVGRNDDQRERDAAKKDRAIAAGHLGLNELGRDLIDKQKQADDKFSSWDAVSEEIIKINEKSWVEAAAAGDRLLRHYAVASKAADPMPADPKAPEAERFNRTIVIFENRDGREPAETNRDFRWQRLFTGQARRAVLDHWYDEDGANPKYFEKVAKAYLDNSDALTPPDPTRAADKAPGHDTRTLLGFNETQFAEFEKLKNAEPLRLAAAVAGLPWTTEPKKQVDFKLTAGAVPPESVAVVWAAFDPKNDKKREIAFAAGSAIRKPLSLKTGDETLTAMLEPPDAAKAVRESVTVRRSGFFRGQVIGKDTPVDLMRMPDVVATHAKALGVLPRVAFVGKDDIDTGVVSIVIDYSPSMTDKPPDGKLSRLDRMWPALKTVLSGLPDKTLLKVRGFGVAPMPGVVRTDSQPFESATTAGISDQTPDGYDPKDRKKEKFPGTFDRRVHDDYPVGWGTNKQALDDFIEELKKVPWQMTAVGENKRGGVNSPVVRSMINAVRQDFDKVSEHQRRVLIVLTDGADNSCFEYDNDGEAARSDGRSLDALEREFTTGKGRGVIPHVLLIKDEFSDKDKTAIDQFRKATLGKLGAFKPPGSIHFEELEKLARTLGELLRPRVRLSKNDKEFELPIHFDDPPVKRERPQWSGPLQENSYGTWVGRLEPPAQQLEFVPSDRMLLRVTRPDPDKPVRFERTLWGRYGRFGEELLRNKRVAEHPDKTWLLSVPMYRSSIAGYLGENQLEMGRHALDVTAAVEDLQSVIGQPLKQPAPAFAWWELSTDVKLTANESTIYTWRDYSHPAPSWRIRRRGWTEAANEERLPETKLQGWVEQRDGALRPREITTIEELSGGTAAGKHPDGTPWRGVWETPDCTIRFDWEDHVFVTNPDQQKSEDKRPCLVVRIYTKNPARQPRVNKKIAPFFVQVDSVIEEHRFFRGVGAYTGYFAIGTSTASESANGRRVRLYSVADLVEPKVGSALEITLPGVSALGGDAVWSRWSESLVPEFPK